MPTISTFLGIVIRMYFNEQAPPHFHVHYNEYDIVISIQGLEVLKGNLPGRVLGLVIEWATEHQDELRANWDLCEQHEQPSKIAPLV
jgi:hypothetical protein